MAQGSSFSIEDAFQSDEEDPIRVYGAFSDSAPLRTKTASKGPMSPGKQPSRDQSYTPLARTEGEAPGANYDTANNEITDTNVGLLSGQVESRNLYRAASSHSFNSSCSDNTGISSKAYLEKRWWKHPKVRDNWKIVLSAVILLVLGIGLFVTGIAIEVTHTKAVQSFIFFIAGAICLIPGVYHVVYVYCAVKGKRGFNFYNLPVFK